MYMVEEEKNHHGYLSKMRDQLNKLIEEGHSLNESTLVYETLTNIINLKLTEKEINSRFEELSDIVISMARLDFSKRMEVPSEQDLFAYISTSINMLNEELGESVVPVNHMQTVIDTMDELVFITNERGYINLINNKLGLFLDFEKEALFSKNINSLFGAEWVLQLVKNGESVENKVCNLLNSDENLIQVNISAQPLSHEHQEISGYLFKIKQ